jgi:hypothetical protein
MNMSVHFADFSNATYWGKDACGRVVAFHNQITAQVMVTTTPLLHVLKRHFPLIMLT